MRLTTTFAISAFAAAAIIAPALAPAVAASSDYFLKIDGVKGESTDARHKGEIEIQSFSWGATRVAGQADALTDGLLIVRYNNDPPPPAAGAAGANGTGMGAGKVNVQDISVMRGPRQTTSLDGTPPVAGTAKFGAVSGVRRDDGMGAGKRTHPPLVKIGKPLDTGSITVAGNFPGCTVGTRYPGAVLQVPGGRYELTDIEIASCPTPVPAQAGAARSSMAGEYPRSSITLNYKKVTVRGWDPEKKEE